MLKWLWVLVIALLVAGCAPAAVPQQDKASLDQASRASEAPKAGAAKSAAAPAAGAPGGAGSSPASGEATASWDRMIIRTANLTLVVGDVEQALAAARDITQTAGGFVAKSSSRYEGEFQLADITIQVPALAYDNTIQRLRGLALRVDNESSSSQDVTEEYTDLDSQLRNLQATEASLVRLLDRSTQISDIIAVQKELTNVRGQIERIQGRMKYLSRRSDMSTISVSLIPEARSKKRPPEGWNPLRSMGSAWEASLTFLRVVVEVALIAVVFLFWLIIPLCVVAFFLWRRRRQRPATGASSPQPSASPPEQ